MEGRGMTLKIISQSISMKVWDRAWIEFATPGSTVRLAYVARHVTNWAMQGHSHLKKSHLDAFSFRLFIWSLLNTASKLSICCSNFEKTTMSPRYMRQSLRFMCPIYLSISHWNVAGALQGERLKVKPKETEVIPLECCHTFILLCNFNLPVPRTEVQFWEIFVPARRCSESSMWEIA